MSKQSRQDRKRRRELEARMKSADQQGQVVTELADVLMEDCRVICGDPFISIDALHGTVWQLMRNFFGEEAADIYFRRSRETGNELRPLMDAVARKFGGHTHDIDDDLSQCPLCNPDIADMLPN